MASEQTCLLCAVGRFAAVAMLAAMALPAFLEGNSWKTIMIGCFAVAALAGVILQGPRKALDLFEVYLLAMLAVSSFATLFPMVMILDKEDIASGVGFCSSVVPVTAYFAILTISILTSTIALQLYRVQIFALIDPAARKPFKPLLVVGFLVLTIALLIVARLVIEEATCSGQMDGRGVVILFSGAFVTLLFSLILNVAIIWRARTSYK